MMYLFKNLFKKKLSPEALQRALDEGLITEEEKYRLEAERADKRLKKFLGKKKDK